MSRQPVLFIGHGSPMHAIEAGSYPGAWNRLGRQLPRPAAILVISAHWFIEGTCVTADAEHAILHDFFGFPRELFEVSYPAPGSPELADKITRLLGDIDVQTTHDRGLDHGAWSVLKHLYPSADVPVVQLSMNTRLTASEHLEIGGQLQGLRDENILILGSGNIVHNLGQLDWRQPTLGYDWAIEFDEWVTARVMDRDHATLCDWESEGTAARLAVPTPEHYLPLLYCAGATSKEDETSFPTIGYEYGGLSMRSLLWQ